MTKRNLRHAELTDRSASGIEPIAASWADEHLGERDRTAAQGLVCNFEQGVACAAVQRVPVVEMCDQGGAGATSPDFSFESAASGSLRAWTTVPAC